MLNQETKRKIDSARDILVGKVPDPKAQVEQITTALMYKFMHDMDQDSVELGGVARFFSNGFEKYAWNKLMDPRLGGLERLNLYADAISSLSQNPYIPQLFRDIFKDAFLPYRSPETLSMFLKEINGFSYEHSEDLGDAFEYLLSVLGSQGDAGQFRTPRHIIDFIVEAVDPKKDETVCDPACGTAGFLISSYKHILRQHDGKDDPLGNEKPLTPDERKALMDNFAGYDISPDMVRISRVNLYLHGFPIPVIHEYDTLSSEDRWDELYDVMLANPPFMSPKGGIRPHKKFSIQANRSEVLFVDYILEHLKQGGRAGIIVPEGIIFQSGKAYKALRKKLVEDGLLAVISLPAGVFNPYSGVKTSILLFDNTLAKRTDKILFVKIQNDGYDLGAQRREIEKNDLPLALRFIKQYKTAQADGDDFEFSEEETPLSQLVSKTIIAKSGDFNLTGDRYKETAKTATQKWPMVKIGEICNLINGRAFKPSDWQKKESGGLPIIRIQNLNNHGSEYNYYNGAVDQKVIVKHGDLLFSWSGSRGTSFGAHIWHGQTAILNQHIFRVEHASQVDRQYLYRILNAAVKEVEENLHGGVGLVHITKGNLESILIPLPPLEVQKEIVEQIEVKQQAIDHAKALIQAIEKERRYFGQSLKKPDCEWVELGDICNDFRNGVNFSRGQVGRGTKFVNIKDVFNSGYVNIATLDKVKLNERELERNILKDDDLLFVRSSVKYEGCGFPSLIKVQGEPIVFCGFVIKCSPDKNKVFPEFLVHLLRSKEFRDKTIGLSNKANITNISQDSLKSLRIPLPTIEKQKELAEQAAKEQEIINANEQLMELYAQKISNVLGEI